MAKRGKIRATSSTETPVRVWWILIVFGIGVTAGGGSLIVRDYEKLQSESWPRTDGTIDSMEVLKKTRRGSDSYTAVTKYRFTVGGREYTGDQFNTVGNALDGEGNARTVLQTYPPGSRCSVAYKPSDPTRCFVDIDHAGNTRVSLVVGGAIGAAGVAALGFGIYGLIARTRRAGRVSDDVDEAATER